MYYLSPFTYLIEGLFGQSVGNLEIVCSSSELVTLNPPGSQSCGDYLKDYISRAGGYLNNPEATASCAFCPYSQTNGRLLLYVSIGNDRVTNITNSFHGWEFQHLVRKSLARFRIPHCIYRIQHRMHLRVHVVFPNPKQLDHRCYSKTAEPTY